MRNFYDTFEARLPLATLLFSFISHLREDEIRHDKDNVWEYWKPFKKNMMTNDSTSPLQSLKSEVFRTLSKIYIRGFIATKRCCNWGRCWITVVKHFITFSEKYVLLSSLYFCKSGKFFQNSCLTEHFRVTTSVITNYLLVIKLLLSLENVKTYVFSVFEIFITLLIFK